MRYSLLIAISAALAVAFPLTAVAEGTVLSMLPTIAPVQAKVMRIAISAEARSIGVRMQIALAAQPSWAAEFLANAVPGQPLPYHPNLQVTEDEYSFFLGAAAKPQLLQVGTISLFAEKQKSGELRLVTEPNTSRLNGITFAPDGSSVTTPLATLTEVRPIKNEDAAAATGRWAGTQWRFELDRSGRVLVVKLAIGKRTDQGDNILYYDVKDAEGSRNDVYYEVLLIPPAK